jgi:ketosteroid isomerase-like protein
MTPRLQPAQEPYSNVQAVFDRFPRSWMPPFRLFTTLARHPDLFERHYRYQEIFMSVAANKKLIQQIYTDSANRSGTTFADHLADDVCWIVTGQYSWSQTFKGRDAVLNGLMGHFRSLFDVRPRIVAYNFIAEGDTVVVEAKGDNVTKTGVRYDNDYCMVWRVEDGKIKMIKEYCDSALVEKVLGPFPRSKAGAEI